MRPTALYQAPFSLVFASFFCGVAALRDVEGVLTLTDLPDVAEATLLLTLGHPTRPEAAVADAAGALSWPSPVTYAGLRLGAALEEVAPAQQPGPKIIKFPTFMFLGMGHSGSTSLCTQLNMHPELSFGLGKEHRYWTSVHPLLRRTLDEYNQSFRVDSQVRHTFDCTPETLFMGNPEARRTQNVFDSNRPGHEAVRAMLSVVGPSMRFIVMFRDPFDFAVSNHYLHHQTFRHCYAESLQAWLDVFPRPNFLFLRSEDYFEDPQGVLDTVCRFMDVEPRPYAPEELVALGRRRYRKRKPSLAQRREFHATTHARSCKASLETQTGLRFSWIDAE